MSIIVFSHHTILYAINTCYCVQIFPKNPTLAHVYYKNVINKNALLKKITFHCYVCRYKMFLLVLFLHLLVYVLLRNFSLIWKRHHCRWRVPKFRPMHIWTGNDLYCVIPAATRGLVFSGLIRRTTPFRSPLTTHKVTRRMYSNPDPRGFNIKWPKKHMIQCFVYIMQYTILMSSNSCVFRQIMSLQKYSSKKCWKSEKNIKNFKEQNLAP
jgi:hypothetical protein